MKFSTFHSFMLTDAKGVAPDHLLEGQRVGATHHRAIADELALIRAADRLGFDTCWMREHHFTDYGFLPNTMTMAAHAAALTERIRLGTAVITLPLHHPIRVAEEIALVDVLSGGRVDVGIGRGYQSVEFDAFAVPLDEARARTDEAIEVLRALWTQDRVDHHGRFWDFDGVHLQPKPVQQPCPPIYYASVNIDSISHYAAKGIPFIVDSTVRTGRLAELADLWLGVARAGGHDAPAGDLVAVRYVWLDDSDDDARDYVARAPKVTSLSTDPRLLPAAKTGASLKATSTGRRAGTVAISRTTTTNPIGTTVGSPVVPDESSSNCGHSKRWASATCAACSGSRPHPRRRTRSSAACSDLRPK